MESDLASRPISVKSSTGTGVRAQGLGSLSEALDRILTKGVTVDGAVTIGVAGVELILLDLRLLLASIDTAYPDGLSFFGSGPRYDSQSLRPPPPPDPSSRAGPVDRRPRVSLVPEAGLAELDPGERKGPQHGLVKLVLTLVNLLHEVLERQAVRRMDNDTLTPAQVEDIGNALHAQATEIARLRQQFGLTEADLSLNLSGIG
jgi:hypothetical protein